jgi:NodT family efflux transporter outer membrane factor (OMF) lipoprotein
MQTCKWLVGAVAWLFLGGCAVGPNYHPPETKMPDNFIASSSQTQKSAENKGNQPVIDAAKWWEALNDQELNSLLDRAIRANPDIQIALYRLQQARTAVAVAVGTALPSAGFSAGGANGTGSDLSRGGRVAGPLAAAETTTNKGNLKQVEYIVGFASAWEIDFAGKYRRAIEAAKYDTQAAIAIRNFVLVSVIADVVRAYIDMRAFQMELAVLQKNIAVAQDYVNLTQERFNRGITNELDLALAQRQFATLKAQEKPLVEEVSAAQYVIAVLVGQFPEDLAGELQKPAMLPQLPEKIEPGLPLDLLRRRPDIQETERELAGATARIGVATADLFPRVVLLGGFGWEGGEVGPATYTVSTVTVNKKTGKKTTTTTTLSGSGGGVLPNIISPIWSLGPSIAWPLLDFGTVDSLVDIADLHTCELLMRYKRTVLNAVQEVDTSVGAYAAQQERLHSLEEALTASQRVMSLATQRYERGLTDFLNVIDAERQEYDLEEQYVTSLREAADQFIALYKALGSGWEQYQSFPPIRKPLPAVLAAFERLLNPDETKKCEW